MEFIKYDNKYYEFFRGKYFNCHDGYVQIPRFVIESTPLEEYESWHDLYEKTGYMPIKCDTNERNTWCAPDGQMYEGQSHALEATYITEIIYGNDLDLGEAEEFLIERGWVKLTTSNMYYYYAKDGMYKNLTRAQYEQINIWCIEHGINLKLEEPIC